MIYLNFCSTIEFIWIDAFKLHMNLYAMANVNIIYTIQFEWIYKLPFFDVK